MSTTYPGLPAGLFGSFQKTKPCPHCQGLGYIPEPAVTFTPSGRPTMSTWPWGRQCPECWGEKRVRDDG